MEVSACSNTSAEWTTRAQVHVNACASVQDQHQVHVRVVSLVSPDCVITTGDNQRIVCG